MKWMLAGLVAAAIGCGEVADGGALHWQRDPKKGMEHARFVGKPMVLYFTSDG